MANMIAHRSIRVIAGQGSSLERIGSPSLLWTPRLQAFLARSQRSHSGSISFANSLRASRALPAAAVARAVGTRDFVQWDSHQVAVWAFQETDGEVLAQSNLLGNKFTGVANFLDPAVLEFFAQKMRLNGESLLRLVEKARTKEVKLPRQFKIEVQMRSHGIQFADVKLDILRDALREIKQGPKGKAPLSASEGPLTVQFASYQHVSSDRNQPFSRKYSGTYYSIRLQDQSSFVEFLRSEGAIGVSPGPGVEPLLTHITDLRDGETYVTVLPGGSNVAESWLSIRSSSLKLLLTSQLSNLLNLSSPLEISTARDGVYIPRKNGTSTHDAKPNEDYEWVPLHAILESEGAVVLNWHVGSGGLSETTLPDILGRLNTLRRFVTESAHYSKWLADRMLVIVLSADELSVGVRRRLMKTPDHPVNFIAYWNNFDHRWLLEGNRLKDTAVVDVPDTSDASPPPTDATDEPHRLIEGNSETNGDGLANEDTLVTMNEGGSSASSAPESSNAETPVRSLLRDAADLIRKPSMADFSGPVPRTSAYDKRDEQRDSASAEEVEGWVRWKQDSGREGGSNIP
ncbi:hypothetical protein HDU93_007736 [Gonapodya sp. JEL0774]|nr:hypothetical protein HDU93_007736 [Gonapodya sp. JEL0774]